MVNKSQCFICKKFTSHCLYKATEESKSKWMAALKTVDVKLPKHLVLCYIHFEAKCFSKSNTERLRLIYGSVPTLFLEKPPNFDHTCFRYCDKENICTKKVKPKTLDALEQPPKKRLLLSTSGGNLAKNNENIETNLMGKENKIECDKKDKKAKDTCECKLRSFKKLKKINQVLKKKLKSSRLTIKKLYSTIEKLNTQYRNSSWMKSEIIQNEYCNYSKAQNARRYSDEIKQICITLHYYSPKSYNFIRSIMSFPHPQTLTKWTSHIEKNPGFFLGVIESIGKQAEKNGLFRDCNLIVDSFSIKQGTFYNPNSGKFEGFTDYGIELPSLKVDENTLAKEALTFMVVGIQGFWKFPIGYFLLEKIASENLKILTKIALNHLAQNKLNVWAFICDGAESNLKTLKSLGCDINPQSIKTTLDLGMDFPTPVCGMLDACHMLKLARNMLHDYGQIFDGDGNPICWNHFEFLHLVQKELGLKLANKIGPNHIYFQNQKMKVSLAAQTLSSSAADAFSFLNKIGAPKFQNCAGTIKFTKNIDTMFDLLNSKVFSGKSFKKPLSLSWEHLWKEKFDYLKHYLLNLKKQDGTLLYKSKRKTFIIGFLMAMDTIRHTATHLLKRSERPLKFVRTYTYSQDHLETFFGCIRNLNGTSNNPTRGRKTRTGNR